LVLHHLVLFQEVWEELEVDYLEELVPEVLLPVVVAFLEHKGEQEDKVVSSDQNQLQVVAVYLEV
jgi:hypothetical protein